ncbi:MAG TPA: ABC transporter substrate-binding protein [Chloroflexota bacterium]|jgi:NitT/TauT family transport system substrate-binding protein|nr:ABC transporter substrate-binding protein [Chloroflexota bacterium]
MKQSAARRGLLGVLAASALLAACAAPAPRAPQGAAAASPTAARPAMAATAGFAAARLAAPTPVKVGYTPFISMAPLFIALERGYFDALNLHLEMIRFNSGALMVAPLSTGELDFGGGGLNAGLYNALSRDIRIRIVADGSRSRPGWGTSVVLVRKDLWDSGAVRSPTDLRGRRVSFATEGSPIDYMMRNWIQQHGLTMDDLEVLRLTSSDVAVGFQNRALDVATASEPFPTQAVASGLAARWLDDGDVVPGMQISALFASERVVGQPEVMRAFLTAYVRAIREYLAADAGRAAEDMLAAISKWTTVPVETLRQTGAPYFDPGGQVDVEDLQRQQEFWLREGMVRERADLGALVDLRFAEAASQLLDGR